MFDRAEIGVRFQNSNVIATLSLQIAIPERIDTPACSPVEMAEVLLWSQPSPRLIFCAPRSVLPDVALRVRLAGSQLGALRHQYLPILWKIALVEHRLEH